MAADRRPVVRVALAWGTLAGLVTLVTMPLLQPGQVGLASDAYYHAARAVLAGQTPYLAQPAGVAPFVYPPAIVLAFVPHALTGSSLGAYVLQTALNVVTLVALAALLVRLIERDHGQLPTPDRLLVAAFVVASAHATTVLVMGQVNLQLALAIALGGIYTERGRDAAGGVAFALAAAVKLFPAVAGVWLLRLGRVRVVATAIATGLVTLALGAVLVGRDAFLTYATAVLPGQTHTESFAGGLPPDAMYVTVRRPIAALLPDVDPGLYLPLALLVLGPAVLASYREVASRDGRRTALLATMLATIVALPLEGFYFSLVYFPLVPLLFSLEPGRPRRALALGTLLLSTPVTARTVRRTLAVLPFPEPIVTPTEALAGVLTVVQPQLVGACVVLAGCVLYHNRAATPGS